MSGSATVRIVYEDDHGNLDAAEEEDGDAQDLGVLGERHLCPPLASH